MIGIATAQLLANKQKEEYTKVLRLLATDAPRVEEETNGMYTPVTGGGPVGVATSSVVLSIIAGMPVG